MEIIYKAQSNSDCKKSYQIASCWLNDLKFLEHERSMFDKLFKSHLLSACNYQSFNVVKLRRRLEHINSNENSLRKEIAAHHTIIEMNIKELACSDYDVFNALGSALQVELKKYKSSYREYRRALDKLTEVLICEQD